MLSITSIFINNSKKLIIKPWNITLKYKNLKYQQLEINKP